MRTPAVSEGTAITGFRPLQVHTYPLASHCVVRLLARLRPSAEGA